MKELFIGVIESPDIIRLRKWYTGRCRRAIRNMDTLEDIDQQLVLYCYQKYVNLFDPEKSSLFNFIKARMSDFFTHYTRTAFAKKNLIEAAEFDEQIHGCTTTDHDLEIIEDRIRDRLDQDHVVVYTLIRLGWTQQEIADRIGKSKVKVYRMIEKVIRPIVKEELCVT